MHIIDNRSVEIATDEFDVTVLEDAFQYVRQNSIQALCRKTASLMIPGNSLENHLMVSILS